MYYLEIGKTVTPYTTLAEAQANIPATGVYTLKMKVPSSIGQAPIIISARRAENNPASEAEIKKKFCAAKIAAVEARTTELFRTGFTYNGIRFSLDRESQANLSKMFQFADFIAPIKYPSYNGSEIIAL